MFEVILSQQNRIVRQSKNLIRLQPIIFCPIIYIGVIFTVTNIVDEDMRLKQINFLWWFVEGWHFTITQGYVVKSKHEHNALYSQFVSRMNQASLIAISHRAELMVFFKKARTTRLRLPCLCLVQQPCSFFHNFIRYLQADTHHLHKTLNDHTFTHRALGLITVITPSFYLQPNVSL